VNITSYAGQTVYIAFRNNSNDKFLLLIDDVKVERLLSFDASVTAAPSSQYAQIPLSQASNLTLGGRIDNLGSQGLNNVRLGARIYNAGNTLVNEVASASISTLAAGANANFTLPAWTPSAPGTYTVRYFPIQNEADQL